MKFFQQLNKKSKFVIKNIFFFLLIAAAYKTMCLKRRKSKIINLRNDQLNEGNEKDYQNGRKIY